MSYKISGGVQDVLDSAASLADVKSTTCTDGQLVAVKGTTFTDASVIIDSYSANAVLKIEKDGAAADRYEGPLGEKPALISFDGTGGIGVLTITAGPSPIDGITYPGTAGDVISVLLITASGIPGPSYVTASWSSSGEELTISADVDYGPIMLHDVKNAVHYEMSSISPHVVTAATSGNDTDAFPFPNSNGQTESYSLSGGVDEDTVSLHENRIRYKISMICDAPVYGFDILLKTPVTCQAGFGGDAFGDNSDGPLVQSDSLSFLGTQSNSGIVFLGDDVPNYEFNNALTHIQNYIDLAPAGSWESDQDAYMAANDGTLPGIEWLLMLMSDAHMGGGLRIMGSATGKVDISYRDFIDSLLGDQAGNPPAPNTPITPDAGSPALIPIPAAVPSGAESAWVGDEWKTLCYIDVDEGCADDTGDDVIRIQDARIITKPDEVAGYVGEGRFGGNVAFESFNINDPVSDLSARYVYEQTVSGDVQIWSLWCGSSYTGNIGLDFSIVFQDNGSAGLPTVTFDGTDSLILEANFSGGAVMFSEIATAIENLSGNSSGEIVVISKPATTSSTHMDSSTVIPLVGIPQDFLGPKYDDTFPTNTYQLWEMPGVATSDLVRHGWLDDHPVYTASGPTASFIESFLQTQGEVVATLLTYHGDQLGALIWMGYSGMTLEQVEEVLTTIMGNEVSDIPVPLMALMFLPMVSGMNKYHWSGAGGVENWVMLFDVANGNVAISAEDPKFDNLAPMNMSAGAFNVVSNTGGWVFPKLPGTDNNVDPNYDPALAAYDYTGSEAGFKSWVQLYYASPIYQEVLRKYGTVYIWDPDATAKKLLWRMENEEGTTPSFPTAALRWNPAVDPDSPGSFIEADHMTGVDQMFIVPSDLAIGDYTDVEGRWVQLNYPMLLKAMHSDYDILMKKIIELEALFNNHVINHPSGVDLTGLDFS